MKKIRSIAVKTVSITLAAATALSFAACAESGDGYFVEQSVVWNEEGVYETTVSLSEESGVTFSDISSDLFEMRGYLAAASSDGVEAASAEFTVHDYTVSKTDDKTLSVAFRSPFPSETALMFDLASKSGVTSDGKRVGVTIETVMPEITATATADGAWSGSDEMTVDVTLRGADYVSALTPEMFTMPVGFTGELAVERTSAQTARLTIRDMPSLATDSFALTVRAEAIDFAAAQDVVVSVAWDDPYVTVESVVWQDASSFRVHALLPSDMTGEAGGVSIAPSVIRGYDFSLTQSSYDADANAYDFTVNLTNIYTAPDLSLEAAQQLAQSIAIEAKLKQGEKTFTVSFTPVSFVRSVRASVVNDYEAHTASVTFTVENGAFRDGLTAEAVTYSVTEGTSPFGTLSLESASASSVRVTLPYTPEDAGYFVTFTLNGEAFEDGAEEQALVYIPVYEEARDYLQLAIKLGKSAASSFAGAIGGSVAELVMPYVYDFFGIDTSDPQLNAINQSIKELTSAVDQLSSDIANVQGAIRTSSNYNTLDSFQQLDTYMTSTYLSLMSKDAVTNVAIALMNAMPNADLLQINENTKRNYQLFSDFYEILKKYNMAEGFNTFETEVGYYNGMLSLWDSCFSNLKDAIIDWYGYGDTGQQQKMAEEASALLSPYANVYPCEELYVNFEYAQAVRGGETAVSEEQKTAFVEAIGTLPIANGYVASVLDYGNRLLATSSGLKSGIVGLYFETIDSIYNFESQTTAAKRSFLARVQSTYLANAAIALEYCSLMGDANVNSLMTQLRNVLTALDAKFSELDAADRRAAEGKDVLLVTGTVVSKQMICVQPAANEGINTSDFSKMAKIPIDSLYSATQRAAARGMSLAEELIAAGFTNVKANNDANKQYVYVCNNVKQVTDYDGGDSFGSWFLTGLSGIFTGKTRTREISEKADVVVQVGRDEATRHADMQIEHCKVTLKFYKNENTYEYTKSHSVYLAFQKA